LRENFTLADAGDRIMRVRDLLEGTASSKPGGLTSANASFRS
jgi:hypothetical protein